MNDEGGIKKLGDLNVPRETLQKLQLFVQLVLDENRQQNLIAASTEQSIWDRHILDSAQLLRFAPNPERCWLDVGSGAGFPGVVLALLTHSHHLLVEPRRRRADFLQRAAQALGLGGSVRVLQSSVESLADPIAGTITARAVSSVDKLLAMTQHLADRSTTWLLHKGRNASAEVDDAKAIWNAHFERLPSMTDAESAIVRITDFAGRRAR